MVAERSCDTRGCVIMRTLHLSYKCKYNGGIAPPILFPPSANHLTDFDVIFYFTCIINHISKVLKCGVGEGWRTSVGRIMQEMK